MLTSYFLRNGLIKSHIARCRCCFSPHNKETKTTGLKHRNHQIRVSSHKSHNDADTRVTMMRSHKSHNDADTRCKSHKPSLYEVLRDVNDADKQMEGDKECCVLCKHTGLAPAPATGVTAWRVTCDVWHCTPCCPHPASNKLSNIQPEHYTFSEVIYFLPKYV